MMQYLQEEANKRTQEAELYRIKLQSKSKAYLELLQQGRSSSRSMAPTHSTHSPRVKIPHIFMCPITRDIFVAPVVASDGHSYEHSAILKWLSTHSTSPLTGAVLETKDLTPNFHLRSQIAEYMATQADYGSSEHSCKNYQPQFPACKVLANHLAQIGGMSIALPGSMDSNETDVEASSAITRTRTGTEPAPAHQQTSEASSRPRWRLSSMLARTAR
jgi:hypothetical protein